MRPGRTQPGCISSQIGISKVPKLVESINASTASDPMSEKSMTLRLLGEHRSPRRPKDVRRGRAYTL